MEDIYSSDTKKELAYWLKQFLSMKESDFDSVEDNGFTMIQRVAYNYVKKSKEDTKIAEKVVGLVQWYETDLKWSIG